MKTRPSKDRVFQYLFKAILYGACGTIGYIQRRHIEILIVTIISVILELYLFRKVFSIILNRSQKIFSWITTTTSYRYSNHTWEMS